MAELQDRPESPVADGALAPDERRSEGSEATGWSAVIARWARRNSAVASVTVVLVAIVVFTAIRSDRFLTAGNIRNVLLQSAVLAIVASGMTLLMVSGGIDLSVGAMASLVGVVAAEMMNDGGSVFLAIITALALSTTIGATNGVLAAYSRSHPFIVTLGVGILLRGIAVRITDGLPISGLPQGFNRFASNQSLGLANPVWFAIGALILVALVLRYTVFGRRLYAIGGNSTAAELAGVRVRRQKIALYAVNGLLVGVAALLLTSRISSASAFMGDGLELRAIAAVAVGGTPLAGGRGGVGGTLIGVLLLGVISNSLNLLGIESAWQDVIEGSVVVVAVMSQRSRT
ncbi:MAG: ABC transporter permease [Acidimicrobiales bacterium]